MRAMKREYEGPAEVGGLNLPKVRIRTGVEESDPLWASPGEPALQMRWWEGEATGDDPGILRMALAIPDGPVEVVLPTGRAMAHLTFDITRGLDEPYPEWRLTLQGAGPSPLG